MLLVRQFADDGVTVEFVDPNGEYKLGNLHPLNDKCILNGCVVHSPTPGPMQDFPYWWRADRAIMERLCPHGVGHPDHDSVRYYISIGEDWQAVHGCDGCCMDDETKAKYFGRQLEDLED